MPAAIRSEQPRPGFNFTQAIRPLCADLVARLPQLAHIDLDRVGIGFSQARSGGKHGVLASLTPLRFAGGEPTTQRRGRLYTVQPVRSPEGVDLLYLLTFALPRFMNHDLEEKLSTVVHELWHISPEFNGDLRRFAGRRYAHGHSCEAFHAEAASLARAWLSLSPPASLYDFLRLNFTELEARHGSVYGTRYPRPKLVPIRSAAQGRSNANSPLAK